MDPEHVSLLFLTVVIVILVYVLYTQKVKENFSDFNANTTFNALPAVFSTKPTLYWFCDSETNARNWNDFGARNSQLPNRGYLEVALKKAIHTQKDFHVVPVIGRNELFALLPDLDPAAKQLPPKLWREFVIANILWKKGGLVMDGDSTLCIGNSFYPFVKNIDTATFGINPDEPIVSPLTAVSPGPSSFVGWSKHPNHPVWKYSADIYNTLLARGPQAWDSALARRMNQYIWEKQKQMGCSLLRGLEGSRLATGKFRQLEDIFGRLSEPIDPHTMLSKDAIYISYDGEDLQKRYEFNWFLRLSPRQLKESDFMWAKLAF